MSQSMLDQILTRPFVIGMVHLLPLPGSPRAESSADPMKDVLARALADVDALVEGGCHAIMMENFGDAPFFPGAVPPSTLAAMTRAAAEIRRRCPDVPLGINVLRNDGLGALAIALAVGADFIRVNVLTGARVTDQGLIQGIAPELMRARAALSAGHVAVLADVDVKHSVPLAPRPLIDEVHDTVQRGGADALIVSGAGTGKPTDPAKLESVKRAAGGRPVIVGSGVSVDTLPALRPHADGFIVGTSLKVGADPAGPVDLAKVKQLIAALT